MSKSKSKGKLKILEVELRAEGKFVPTDSFHIKIRLGQYYLSVAPKQIKEATNGVWIVTWGEGSRLLDMKESVCNFNPSKIEEGDKLKIELWCFSETGNDLCMGSARLGLREQSFVGLVEGGAAGQAVVAASLPPTEDGTGRAWAGSLALTLGVKPYAAAPPGLHPAWKPYWRVWHPPDVALLWGVWAGLAGPTLQPRLLTSVAAEVLAKALGSAPALRTLDLSDNQLEDGKPATALFTAISKLTQLQHFAMNNSPDHTLLSTALPLITSLPLVTLSLAGCELEDEHLLEVVGLLQRNSLTRLDLSRNHISDDGIEGLVEALPVATALTSLDLSGNEIDNQGFKTLMRFLQAHPTVKELALDDNIFDPKVAQKFRGLVKSHQVLKESALDREQDAKERAEEEETLRIEAEIARDKEVRRQTKERLALEKQHFLEKQAKREQRHNQLRDRRAALNKNISDLDKKLSKWKSQLESSKLGVLSSSSSSEESEESVAPTLEQRRQELLVRAQQRRQRKSQQY